MSEDKERDIVFLHSPTEDGDGMRVVRARNGTLETGEVRAVAEGKPLRGEIVSLRPREGSPRVCDVKVEYSPAPPSPTERAGDGQSEAGKGPAQVATERYRDNWEAIFGGPRTPKRAPALN